MLISKMSKMFFSATFCTNLCLFMCYVTPVDLSVYLNLYLRVLHSQLSLFFEKIFLQDLVVSVKIHFGLTLYPLSLITLPYPLSLIPTPWSLTRSTVPFTKFR